MTGDPRGDPSHWHNVYETRPDTGVSWYRPHLDVSLRLLERAGVGPRSRVIDVGGGASTLVDDLLTRGVGEVAVLDLVPAALAIAQARLGEHAARVRWIAGDVTTFAFPEAAYTHWHDRAVLHFLTAADDARAYARQAGAAIAPDGRAVIGGFAPDGPERCSGLAVARRSADDIAALLGGSFVLEDRAREHHRTPSGAVQAFVYALLRRR